MLSSVSGKCLSRLFELRGEVKVFLESDTKFKDLLMCFNDTAFQRNFAFLTDITSHLNSLNISLQGHLKTIFECISIIEGFKSKLSVLKEHLLSNNLEYFPACKELAASFPELNFVDASKNIDTLLQQFDKRFSDIYEFKKITNLFMNPLSCNVLDFPTEIQQELPNMQSDIELKFSGLTGIAFWKHPRTSEYREIQNAILKGLCMFPTTYSCEQTFSLMKIIKSEKRNSLTDKHLKELLRIKCYKKEIDWSDLLKNCF